MTPSPPSPQEEKIPKISKRIPIKCRPQIDSLLLFREMMFTEDEMERIEASPTIQRRLREMVGGCMRHHEAHIQAQQQYEEDQGNRMAAAKLKEASWSLKGCLARTSCPHPWESYTRCWSNMKPGTVMEHYNADSMHHLCEHEKRAVETCTGKLVSSAVRLAEGDPHDF